MPPPPTPSVSVVVPTRDRPAELATALASVRSGSRAPMEIIVVDDGSDPPADVDDDDVLLLRVDSTGGPARARNLGVAAARGDVIAFLDDDDTWRPDYLERQLVAMDEAGAAAAVCGWVFHDEHDRLDTVVPPAASELAGRLQADPVVAPSCLVIRRATFDALEGFDPALRYGEDWDLAVRLVAQQPVAVIADALVDRQLHSDARYGPRLVRDHLTMIRRLAPTATGDARRRHLLRLAQYSARVALEPVVVGRAPWRARAALRRRRAQRAG